MLDICTYEAVVLTYEKPVKLQDYQCERRDLTTLIGLVGTLALNTFQLSPHWTFLFIFLNKTWVIEHKYQGNMVLLIG